MKELSGEMLNRHPDKLAAFEPNEIEVDKKTLHEVSAYSDLVAGLRFPLSR